MRLIYAGRAPVGQSPPTHLRSCAKLVLLLAMLSSGSAVAEQGKKKAQKYSPIKLEDMEALATKLKEHVAYLEVELIPTRGQPLFAKETTGFGAALSERLIVTLCFNVKDARRIEVIGPKGSLPGQIVLYDVDRRVALLETAKPLATIGLSPVRMLPAKERQVGMDIFALISTKPGAGVLHGVLTHNAEMPEYEGHPRIDLLLLGGMPVFDNTARLVGYSRVVAWDKDRMMLIPPEMIEQARKPTSKPAPKEKGPWWVK